MSAPATIEDVSPTSTIGDRSGELPSSATDRFASIVLAGFGLAIVVGLWGPVLTHGLMTDELLSAWVSSDGIGDAVQRAQDFQGNSPLYFVLLWAWRAVAGSTEWVLRLPSVLCLLAAAWNLHRLGVEIDGGRRITGAVAAFVLLADTDVLLAGTTARPYALLMLLVVVSARTLLSFLHDGSWPAGLAWVSTAAASLLMSPFAALVLVAHCVAIFDAARGRPIPLTRATRLCGLGNAPDVWRRRLPVLIGIGVVATLPLVPQIVALSRRSDELVTAPLPGSADLVDVVVPVSLTIAVVLGVVAGGWRGAWSASDPVLRFVSAWALGPAILTWVMSNLTGTSIWVGRYRIGAIAGLALLVGLGVGRIARPQGRVVAVAAIVIVSLWWVSGTAGIFQHGWREAVDWARSETAGEPVTIALDSDLVESTDLGRLEDPAWREYLSGPVEHYGLPGEIVLLPKGVTGAVDDHQRRVIDRLAAGTDTVVVISPVLFRDPPEHLPAIREALVRRGWVETAGPVVGPHQAVVFRR